MTGLTLMQKHKTASFFILGFLAIASLAYFVQTKLFLSPDVAYLLHAATILLNGGNYVTDIFETNPPMIMYLYFPVCWLIKYTAMNGILALRLYVLLLTFFSSALCFYLLKKITKPDDSFLRILFLLVLWYVFLFAPYFELGQREHLLVLLITPYLLTVVAQLENKKISPHLTLLIGCMAGFGFAIKPFFLIPLVFIELFAMWKKRSLMAWWRMESMTIGCVMVSYLFILSIFHSDYLNTILPLVLQYYFAYVKEPWQDIISSQYAIFCSLSLVAYFFLNRTNAYHTLTTVLWLALLGLFIAFLIPRTAWYYHVLPALSFAYLLNAVYLGQLISPAKNRIQYIIFALSFSLVFFLPIYASYHHTKQFLNNSWHEANDQLIHFFAAMPGQQTIYCFTPKGTMDCFPMISVTHNQFAGRFPFFWWAGIFKQPKITTKVAADTHFFLNQVTEDLDRYKPKWIVVNAQQQDFLPNLIHADQPLAEAWQHYHYFISLYFYQIYLRDT